MALYRSSGSKIRLEGNMDESNLLDNSANQNSLSSIKIGQWVRSNIYAIISYCSVSSDEISNLTDPAYSKEVFGLNWPFFCEEGHVSNSENIRYWKDRYTVGDRHFRVCSQWFERQRQAFDLYLVKCGIDIDVAPETSKPSPIGMNRKGRYKATAIGNAQNLFVRVLLSNIGQESITQSDWANAKKFFGDACAYCGSVADIHMDHAIPINRTALGEHRLGNLIPSCKPCNDAKHYAGFREFLKDRPAALEKIESYMSNSGYTPLVAHPQISLIIEEAHAEVAALADRYIRIINAILHPS